MYKETYTQRHQTRSDNGPLDEPDLGRRYPTLFVVERLPQDTIDGCD